MNESQETDTNEELEIILGQQDVTLGTGETITIREYGGFIEGMKVDAIAAPLVHDLGGFFDRISEGEGFDLLELSALFGAHPEVMTQLISLACDKPVEWLEGLNDEDGQLLLAAWWGTNQSFFLRRLVKERMARKMAAQAITHHQDGEASLRA